MTATRLPPHDVPSEESLVAVALADPRQLGELAGIVRPEHFFREANGLAWSASLDLWQRGEPVHQISVAHLLAARGHLETVGGQAHLADCVRACPTTEGALWYAENVRRAYNLRRLVSAGHTLSEAALGDGAEPTAVADAHLARLLTLGIDRSRPLTQAAGDILEGGLAADMRQHVVDPTRIRGLSTGWRALDRMLDGLRPSRLYTLLADTNVGKSLMAQNLLRNVARDGTAVLLFTTEMSQEEVVERLVWMEAQVDPVAARIRGDFSVDECVRFEAGMERAQGLPIHVCDQAGLPLDTLRGEARRMVEAHGIGLVAIDHIQHIRVPGATGTAVIEAVMAGLKGLAMDCEVPVVAVSHINRASQAAGALSHYAGKGASAIEQDSNVQIALEPVRPNGASWELLNQAQATDVLNRTQEITLRLTISKNRSGPRGACYLRQSWRLGGRMVEVMQ